MRMFLAVDIESGARAAVMAIVNRLRRTLGDKGPRVTWVGGAQLHITLHFLGEVDDSRVERIRALHEPPLAIAPFQLSLGRIGTFPAYGAPRVIWIGLDEGRAELASIHDDLGERLRAIGVAVESRSFAPHLTIGRIRSRIHPSSARALSPAAIDPPIRSAVECVTAYESRLTRDGPQYHEIVRVPLTPP